MTRIALLTPNLTVADAVSNDVLSMRDVLRRRGHEVSIFVDSSNIPDEPVEPPAAALSFLSNPEDVLLYHHSIGFNDGMEVMKALPCRKIIKYHNITPPQFFAGISEAHQRLCETGRSQLKEIIACQPDLYLADSAFNKTDLVAAGGESSKTFVLPPFNQGDQLLAGEVELEFLDEFDDDTVNLMTVGGVRPNKGHADLIEAFAIYYYNFNAQARLFIIGAENEAFKEYETTLQRLIDWWSIGSRIVFSGAVSSALLKSYYAVADACLITSEHEGFCVPLVEAMAMKVPIIAFSSTAIPETAGDAAIIWSKRDPYLMAQSIDFIQTNEAAKMALLYRGSRRYEQSFSYAAIEKQFLEMTARAGFAF